MSFFESSVRKLGIMMFRVGPTLSDAGLALSRNMEGIRVRLY